MQKKKHFRDHGKLILFLLLTFSEPSSVNKMLNIKTHELTFRWLNKTPGFCLLLFDFFFFEWLIVKAFGHTFRIHE